MALDVLSNCLDLRIVQIFQLAEHSWLLPLGRSCSGSSGILFFTLDPAKLDECRKCIRMITKLWRYGVSDRCLLILVVSSRTCTNTVRELQGLEEDRYWWFRCCIPGGESRRKKIGFKAMDWNSSCIQRSPDGLCFRSLRDLISRRSFNGSLTA